MTQFVMRNENFGATLYDKRKLEHKFLTKEEFSKQPFLSDDVDMWLSDLSKSPKDIIYSPLRIYFELTSMCNLKCKTCFNNSGKKGNNEMSTEEIKNVLQGLKKDHVFDVRFTGGELTLRPDWLDLLRYAKNLGFAVSVNTNGVYSNLRIIDELASLDLNQVTISLDGFGKNNDYIRGEGTFDKIIETLSELNKRGVHLRINTVLTKNLDDDLEAILQIADKFVEEINFFYMRTTGRALDILDNKLSYEELFKFSEQVEDLKPKYPKLNILCHSKVMLRRSIRHETSKKLGIKMGGPDGFTHLNILPDGSIWPGGYTPHIEPKYNLGNIKEEGYTLLHVWRHSPLLKEFRERSLKLQEICLSCSENSVRCPGASMEMELYREKNPKKKNPYCLF